ncbi:hypothetical protein EDD17DRAFT_1901444 [Pisolithus thermaeus]|nr:hypothetical protein EV401DRAFT_1882839 [Pisolithus croceorrhizus]KAI6146553.1 hypothetical protein EDD17DRAFT_1901444 [Pisolithus thermaeus]
MFLAPVEALGALHMRRAGPAFAGIRNNNRPSVFRPSVYLHDLRKPVEVRFSLALMSSVTTLRTRVPTSAIKPDDVVLLIMGKTWSRMSNFINTLTGTKPEVGADELSSCNSRSPTDVRSFQLFRPLCGSKAVDRVCLVTTMWDVAEKSEADEVEGALEGILWLSLIQAGTQSRRFENTLESAWNIVEGTGNTTKRFYFKRDRWTWGRD